MLGIISKSHYKFSRNLLMTSTFFEYFDLMLYVHMAYILNELFFDHSGIFMQNYGTAIAFCSTFLLKPFGGYVIGTCGDKFGRKSMLVFCTSISALCCFTTASLPTYETIGVLASIILTSCRLLQGLASLGESTSAEIYMAENLQPPKRYYVTALMSYAGVVGMFAAICIVKLVLYFDLNWRLIFLSGGIIVAISYFYRKEMAESVEFSTAQKQFQGYYNIDSSSEEGQEQIKHLNMGDSIKKSSFQTRLNYFFAFCGWPVCFYFSYIYCGDFLKKNFGFTKVMMVDQNFILAICNMIGLYIWIHLTKYIHPLKILVAKLFLYIPFLMLVPYLLDHSTTPYQILAIQVIGVTMGNSVIPAKGVFMMHFFTLERFRLTAFLSGVSHAAVYLITSMGLTYFSSIFGNYGILFVTLPATLLFTIGVINFTKFEKEQYNAKLNPNIEENYLDETIRSLYKKDK